MFERIITIWRGIWRGGSRVSLGSPRFATSVHGSNQHLETLCGPTSRIVGAVLGAQVPIVELFRNQRTKKRQLSGAVWSVAPITRFVHVPDFSKETPSVAVVNLTFAVASMGETALFRSSAGNYQQTSHKYFNVKQEHRRHMLIHVGHFQHFQSVFVRLALANRSSGGLLISLPVSHS